MTGLVTAPPGATTVTDAATGDPDSYGYTGVMVGGITVLAGNLTEDEGGPTAGVATGVLVVLPALGGGDCVHGVSRVAVSGVLAGA
jgi:hypothetical protein